MIGDEKAPPERGFSRMVLTGHLSNPPESLNRLLLIVSRPHEALKLSARESGASSS